MKGDNKKNGVLAVSETVEDGNIDKIRDILFGSQARDFDRRFSRLEENFAKEVADMRDETRRKLDALEDFIKSELKSLTDRLANERESRTDAVNEVTSEIKTLSNNLDKKMTAMSEQSANSETELRRQILAQSKTLSDEMQKRHNDVLASLQRESDEIRDDKADRSTLADLFTEMALRLNNDFNLPKGD